jgi:autotransporter translocation and assembly factor TamB
LDVDLIFNNRRIEVRNLEGRVLRGSLTASGEASWGNVGIENYQLNTRLNDFQYRYIPEGFRFDGSLDAIFRRLSNGRGEIKGTITANNMEYVADINLSRMILNNAVGSIPSLQSIDFDDPLDTIGLNLDVDLRQPWVFDTNLLKVRGNNRPSERIKIMGTLAKPGMRGGMELITGGRISNILPAGDIIVERGSIDFPDPNVLNPVINIQGQVDITPFRVNLNINGPLDFLNITPNSTPTLRQDEIFSLLLNPAVAQSLGGSAYSTSSTASASSSGLAGAASGLISNLAFAQFLEPVRRTLRFDRVSVAVRTGLGGVFENDIIIGKNINLPPGHTIPIIGSYRSSGETSMIGGQMEVRFGNIVIHFGASGSRSLGVSPSGEVRYSWSSR